MFDSLHIQNFRALEDLELRDLGSVNLLVGRNNIGKTTVLEAIKMRCAGTGAIWEVEKLLNSRQEIGSEPSEEGESRQPWSLERLFYCEANGTVQAQSRRLSIGPIGAPESTLRLELGWIRMVRDETGEMTRQVVKDITGFENDQDIFEAIIINFGDMPRRIHSPGKMLRLGRLRPGLVDSEIGTVNCHYLPARGFTGNEAGDLWDKIVLTDLEFDVLSALKIIEPAIERISLIQSGASARRENRMALVLKSGSHNPEPLMSLGDGMNRIFEMALGLASSKAGILLVDEVENGIHYSVQQELWSLIFEMASRLRSQVFATTHSWDCIEAFQNAASDHPDAGVLIRLDEHDNKILATIFNEQQLEILTKESIEVR